MLQNSWHYSLILIPTSTHIFWYYPLNLLLLSFPYYSKCQSKEPLATKEINETICQTYAIYAYWPL